MLLLGAIGWGLLCFGAITHVWHHRRLRQLLGMHLDHDQPVARLLTGAEILLAVALPAAYIAEAGLLIPAAVAAMALAFAFMAWIARLLLSASDLPCACSFAETPTTVWSLVRAGCTALVGAFIFVDPAGQDVASTVATLLVGLAISGAIFAAPEAVSWPSSSRALLRRIDAHSPHGQAASP